MTTDRKIITMPELNEWLIKKDQQNPLLIQRLLSRTHIAHIMNVQVCSVSTYFLNHHNFPKHTQKQGDKYLYEMDKIIAVINSNTFKKTRKIRRHEERKSNGDIGQRDFSSLDNYLAKKFLTYQL